MTKRFTGEFDKQYSGVYDNGEQLTNFEVVKLLNELHEKNIILLRKNGAMEEEIECLSEENDQLKKENQELQALVSLQEEVMIDAMDKLMDLPSIYTYLAKQWLNTAENYDSIEELQNEFKERLKELGDFE